MDILYSLGAIFIFAPATAFILIVLFARKRMGYRSIGLAADLTTFLLFFSIPVAIGALWNFDAAFISYAAAIIVAIAMLINEWKKSKEIEILKLGRKTWRVYFLLLSIAHCVIWAAGIALTLNDFLTL